MDCVVEELAQLFKKNKNCQCQTTGVFDNKAYYPCLVYFILIFLSFLFCLSIIQAWEQRAQKGNTFFLPLRNYNTKFYWKPTNKTGCVQINPKQSLHQFQQHCIYIIIMINKLNKKGVHTDLDKFHLSSNKTNNTVGKHMTKFVCLFFF